MFSHGMFSQNGSSPSSFDFLSPWSWCSHLFCGLVLDVHRHRKRCTVGFSGKCCKHKLWWLSMLGMPPGGSIPSYQTDTARGGGEGWHGGVFVRILSMLIYITHQQKFAELCVWISCNAHEVFHFSAWKLSLDVIASPNTYPCRWVSQSVMFSDFIDSYRIYRACF